MIKLSLLILTIEDRYFKFNELMAELSKQVVDLSKKDGVDYWEYIEILKDPRGSSFTKGEKRNDLLQSCTGEYCCFIDDDDMVHESYVETLIRAIESKPDCVSLRGVMTTDGENPEMFEHSLKYNEWKTTNNFIKYERYPNHLNCTKSSIAKQFKFPEINYGEDKIWSDAVFNSGLLKNEIYIPQPLYYYQYKSKK
jgi:glycosyltransferase involved in cell wall biosynthesis